MTEKEIQPIAIDGKIIDFKTKEVIEDFRMTEKRFTCETKTQGCVSIDLMKDNGQIIEKFEAINLLNELDEENIELHIQNDFLKDENQHMRKVLEENKELKDKNSQLQETLAFRSNQLALMERLVDDLGSEEMVRQMEELLNE